MRIHLLRSIFVSAAGIVLILLGGCATPVGQEPAAQRKQIFELTYPLDQEQAAAALAKEFPKVPPEQREKWLDENSGDSCRVDGKVRYSGDLVVNRKFRDIALYQQDPKAMAAYRQLYAVLKPIIETNAASRSKGSSPYYDAKVYHGTARLDIPRKELPATGLFRMWIPVPINTGPQSGVKILSIKPRTWVKASPSIDRDIGLVYMEAPLDRLTGNLKVEVKFSYKCAVQRFRVDPARVGQYDRNSRLCRRYTASDGNTALTPAILEESRKIVGNETNPWLAARRIYDHVVRDIKYSFMPHACLWPRGQPESDFVREKGWGDCGAQSVYFSALCRAAGIPARSCGGFQLLENKFGSHFWAEIYMPNYGWIPVDTSVAQLTDYLPEVSEKKRQEYRDFFFGNLDNRRCYIQVDTDVPLIPPADGPILLPMAIQFPAALCDTMKDVPGGVVSEHWKLTLE
jgi:transglutaminase-like putative cysteine protease